MVCDKAMAEGFVANWHTAPTRCWHGNKMTKLTPLAE